MDAVDSGYQNASDGSPGLEAGKGPAEPRSLEALGLPSLFLGHLALKHCFYMDFFTLSDLAERLKVSASIISEVLEHLKKAKWVEVRGPDPMQLVAASVSLANRHSLTDAGRKQAALLIEYDAYAGPAPVVLKDYWRQVTLQGIGKVGVSPDRIQQALTGLVLADGIPEQLGVAAVSGKPLFLYGPAGNGKTAVSQRFAGIWEDDILVPYALFVDGQVIQVFDAITHAPSKPAETAASGGRKWTAGGCGAAGRW